MENINCGFVRDILLVHFRVVVIVFYIIVLELYRVKYSGYEELVRGFFFIVCFVSVILDLSLNFIFVFLIIILFSCKYFKFFEVLEFMIYFYFED